MTQRMEPIGSLSELDVVLALANVRMTGSFPTAGEFAEFDLNRAARFAERAKLTAEYTPLGECFLALLDIPISFSTDPSLGRVVEVGRFDSMHGSGAAALALLHLMQTGRPGTCALRSILSQGWDLMTLKITVDASASVDLHTVGARDAVRLVYGYVLASRKGTPVNLDAVYPVEPNWPSPYRYMSQMGAVDELPFNVLVETIERETGLKLTIDGRRLLIAGMKADDVAAIVELLNLHILRAAQDGMTTMVGVGAVVNAGSAIPLIGWLLDLELLEIAGAASIVGPCAWVFGITLPAMLLQLGILVHRKANAAA